MRREAKELIATYIVLFVATIAVCTFMLGLWGCDSSTAPHTVESDLFGEPIVLDTAYVTE